MAHRTGRDAPAARVVAARAALAALLSAATLSGCGVPAADGPGDTYGLDFSLDRGAETRGAIVFVVDGVNAAVFGRMLSAGELPAIRKYFAQRGLYAPRAAAGAPSVTLANLTSIVTGLMPGHHGVAGVNWFDRNRLVWRNYETIAQKNTMDGDYTAANIYERFPARTTFSVFLQPHRGATKFIENWTSAGPPFFFRWYEFVDRLTLSRFDIVMDTARKRREFPAVTFVYLLAPDFRAYENGVDSEQYRLALKHTDRQIGRVLGDVARAGLLDKIHIAFVSDHGMGQVTRHFPIRAHLRRAAGLDIAPGRLWEKTPFEKRLGHYREYNTVLYGSGDRYWAVCLRKPLRDESGSPTGFAPWPVRPSPADLHNYPGAAPPQGPTTDIPKMLAEIEAVDAAAWSVGPNRVRVRRAGGEVEFRQDGGAGSPISCRVVAGSDPLGWSGKVPADALNGAPMTPREWLAATIETDYPDLPAQIVAYFRCRRAGDIAVFAAPGWDFGNSNRAGHGGLRPADVLTPMLLAGPGVPHGTVPAARTVDLAPTLLKLLGKPVPPGLDGQPLRAIHD